MKIFDDYKKGIFDLSAFGIMRGEDRSDYFCTPKGADIIGWTGVDGIHYCFIKNKGDAVFAVEPMALPGEYVFPVAKSFEDFLRLLIACGDEAVLSQARAWTRERFDSHMREYPMTEEARAASDALACAYGLSPADDPFSYLKGLYESFDAADIEYTDEYYEYVPREAVPHPKKWEVFFSSAIGERTSGMRAGREVPIDARFSWGEYEMYVPMAYSCKEGLVLDIFAVIDRRRFEDFYSSWRAAEPYADMLGEEEYNKLINNNPMSLSFCATLSLNGKKLRMNRVTALPFAPDAEEYSSQLAKSIVLHYGLSKEGCYMFYRVAFPWATKTKPKINSLALTLEVHESVIGAGSFSVNSAGDTFKFTDPTTNTEHTLEVLEYVHESFAERTMRDYDLPPHYVRMNYSITPDIPKNKLFISDTRRSDEPKRKSAPKYDFESVAIAMIGGADGPTAVSLGVPDTGNEERIALSALTFEIQDSVRWAVRIREKAIPDITKTLI